MHTCAVAAPSTPAVKAALKWNNAFATDIAARRKLVGNILAEMSANTTPENKDLIKSLHPDVQSVLKAYGDKFQIFCLGGSGKATFIKHLNKKVARKLR